MAEAYSQAHGIRGPDRKDKRSKDSLACWLCENMPQFPDELHRMGNVDSEPTKSPTSQDVTQDEDDTQFNCELDDDLLDFFCPEAD
jgi:hypothetical protein